MAHAILKPYQVGYLEALFGAIAEEAAEVVDAHDLPKDIDKAQLCTLGELIDTFGWLEAASIEIITCCRNRPMTPAERKILCEHSKRLADMINSAVNIHQTKCVARGLPTIGMTYSVLTHLAAQLTVVHKLYAN